MYKDKIYFCNSFTNIKIVPKSEWNEAQNQFKDMLVFMRYFLNIS